MEGTQANDSDGAADRTRSRILIVASDEATGTQVQEALPDEMYELTVLGDAGEALEQAGTEGACDLILLHTPLTADDDRLLDRFVDRSRSHDIPLVCLGAAADTAAWAPLLHAGASAYVAAPVDADGLAAQVAALLRTKERLDQLRDQAVVDELTRVYNRRYLDEQLRSRLGEAQRYSTPFSVGLIDIDHFKNVNDTHGHAVGDVVLAETAALLRRQMRKEDLLARYGGEEFAILLPHTDRLGAAILAERVREAVADHKFAIDEGRTLSITVSMGLASLPMDDIDSAQQLLHLADERLYEAKGAGRNQTVFD